MALSFVTVLFSGFCFVGLYLTRLSQPKIGKAVIFTPIGLVLLHELFFSWPPAFADWLEGSRNWNWNFVVLLSAMLALAIGFVTFQNLTQNLRQFLEVFHSKKLVETYADSRTGALVGMMILLTLIGLLLYRGIPPAVTNFQKVIAGGYASGTHELMAEQRLDLTKGHHFGGAYRGQGVFRWINRVGWTFVAAVSLLRYGQRKCYRNLLLAVAGLLGGFIFVAGDGTRGPFLWALVTGVVVLSLQFRIRKKHLIGFAGTILAVLVLMSLTQKLSGIIGGGGGAQAIAEKLGERLFLGNGANTNDVIRFIDDGYMERRNGAIHANDFAAAIPFLKSETPFTYEVFLLQNPFLVNDRTTFASMTYLGRLYAEGGLCGVLIGYFVIGITCACLGPFLKVKKTPESTAYNGMIIMAVGQLPLNGIVYFLMSCFVLCCFASVFRTMHLACSYYSVRRADTIQNAACW